MYTSVRQYRAAEMRLFAWPRQLHSAIGSGKDFPSRCLPLCLAFFSSSHLLRPNVPAQASFHLLAALMHSTPLSPSPLPSLTLTPSLFTSLLSPCTPTLNLHHASAPLSLSLSLSLSLLLSRSLAFSPSSSSHLCNSRCMCFQSRDDVRRTT